MSRVKDDIDRIWNAINYVSMLILEIIFHTIIVLYCMYHISPLLAIIPSIILPIMGAVAFFMEG